MINYILKELLQYDNLNSIPHEKKINLIQQNKQIIEDINKMKIKLNNTEYNNANREYKNIISQFDIPFLRKLMVEQQIQVMTSNNYLIDFSNDNDDINLEQNILLNKLIRHDKLRNIIKYLILKKFTSKISISTDDEDNDEDNDDLLTGLNKLNSLLEKEGVKLGDNNLKHKVLETITKKKILFTNSARTSLRGGAGEDNYFNILIVTLCLQINKIDTTRCCRNILKKLNPNNNLGVDIVSRMNDVLKMNSVYKVLLSSAVVHNQVDKFIKDFDNIFTKNNNIIKLIGILCLEVILILDIKDHINKEELYSPIYNFFYFYIRVSNDKRLGSIFVENRGVEFFENTILPNINYKIIPFSINKENKYATFQYYLEPLKNNNFYNRLELKNEPDYNRFDSLLSDTHEVKQQIKLKKFDKNYFGNLLEKATAFGYIIGSKKWKDLDVLPLVNQAREPICYNLNSNDPEFGAGFYLQNGILIYWSTKVNHTIYKFMENDFNNYIDAYLHAINFNLNKDSLISSDTFNSIFKDFSSSPMKDDECENSSIKEVNDKLNKYCIQCGYCPGSNKYGWIDVKPTEYSTIIDEGKEYHTIGFELPNNILVLFWDDKRISYIFNNVGYKKYEEAIIASTKIKPEYKGEEVRGDKGEVKREEVRGDRREVREDRGEVMGDKGDVRREEVRGDKGEVKREEVREDRREVREDRGEVMGDKGDVRREEVRGDKGDVRGDRGEASGEECNKERCKDGKECRNLGKHTNFDGTIYFIYPEKNGVTQLCNPKNGELKNLNEFVEDNKKVKEAKKKAIEAKIQSENIEAKAKAAAAEALFAEKARLVAEAKKQAAAEAKKQAAEELRYTEICVEQEKAEKAKAQSQSRVSAEAEARAVAEAQSAAEKAAAEARAAVQAASETKAAAETKTAALVAVQAAPETKAAAEARAEARAAVQAAAEAKAAATKKLKAQAAAQAFVDRLRKNAVATKERVATEGILRKAATEAKVEEEELQARACVAEETAVKIKAAQAKLARAIKVLDAKVKFAKVAKAHAEEKAKLAASAASAQLLAEEQAKKAKVDELIAVVEAREEIKDKKSEIEPLAQISDLKQILENRRSVSLGRRLLNFGKKCIMSGINYAEEHPYITTAAALGTAALGGFFFSGLALSSTVGTAISVATSTTALRTSELTMGTLSTVRNDILLNTAVESGAYLAVNNSLGLSSNFSKDLVSQNFTTCTTNLPIFGPKLPPEPSEAAKNFASTLENYLNLSRNLESLFPNTSKYRVTFKGKEYIPGFIRTNTDGKGTNLSSYKQTPLLFSSPIVEQKNALVEPKISYSINQSVLCPATPVIETSSKEQSCPYGNAPGTSIQVFVPNYGPSFSIKELGTSVFIKLEKTTLADDIFEAKFEYKGKEIISMDTLDQIKRNCYILRVFNIDDAIKKIDEQSRNSGYSADYTPPPEFSWTQKGAVFQQQPIDPQFDIKKSNPTSQQQPIKGDVFQQQQSNEGDSTQDNPEELPEGCVEFNSQGVKEVKVLMCRENMTPHEKKISNCLDGTVELDKFGNTVFKYKNGKIVNCLPNQNKKKYIKYYKKYLKYKTKYLELKN